MDVNDKVAAEQRQYAGWLDLAARSGLVLLVITFLLYGFGVVPSHVPLEQLPQLWSLPLPEFLERTGAPTGWSWLLLAHKGEYLSLIGVALLALATLVCYIGLASALLRRGERLHAAIAIAQIAVLLVALSGLFAGGH